MVEIGMPVKVIRPYKNGEKREIKIRTKEAVVVGIYNNFILVQYKEGFKECCKLSELWYKTKEGVEYCGYKDKNKAKSISDRL